VSDFCWDLSLSFLNKLLMPVRYSSRIASWSMLMFTGLRRISLMLLIQYQGYRIPLEFPNLSGRMVIGRLLAVKIFNR
jgi:hypothetical protein